MLCTLGFHVANLFNNEHGDSSLVKQIKLRLTQIETKHSGIKATLYLPKHNDNDVLQDFATFNL